MAQMNAYISYNGNCRQAMEFYKSCLGGELVLNTIGESPMAAQCPTAIHGQILHAMLTANGMVLMGSDMQSREPFVIGNNVALSVNCTSEEELRALFSSLSVGGTVMEGPTVMFWGALFAAFTDKFATRWMLNYDKNVPQ